MGVDVIGVCALCLQERELRDSHLVPKALYRLARAVDRRERPDPVFLASTGRQQTSFQASQYLLCADCERRFDQHGEDWVMRHCYRGRDRFRLRNLLEQSKPIHAADQFTVYCASSVPSLSIAKIVYFCASVFWRASVRDWESSGKKYEAISLGVKYQEKIRQYLLGDADFPANAAVMLVASQLRRPAIAFNFPDTVRAGSCHCHRLHIPGLDFLLSIGHQMEPGTTETCIVRSPHHPIIVCKDGDGKYSGSWARSHHLEPNIQS
ncbi:MAG: hypothetical protein ABSD63_07085 [Candidatus Korobacteraceae bacterium]|jgi:hypothetical protein